MDNAWVDSYLDALLSYGLSSEHASDIRDTTEVDAERKIFAKYYVNQLLTKGVDELSAAWHRATSARNLGEKDARLEYLSWRVWNMKRMRDAGKVRRVKEWRAEPADLTTGAALEVEAEDEVEGDSEEEEVAPLASPAVAVERAQRTEAALAGAQVGLSTRKSIKRIEREIAMESEIGEEVQEQDWSEMSEMLYVVMISAHGLVRGNNMELGRDPDTGGQVKYVVELAKALAQHPAVHRVDLLTRLIQDPSVDASYGEPEECLWAGPEPSSGAFIVRLPFGPTDKYLRKELLWPHLRELADRGVAHVQGQLQALNAGGAKVRLYAVHGHYADAAEAAAMLASSLGVEMVMTGHSLGRNKLEHLLKGGSLSRAEIERTYNITRRVEGEERGLDHASVVFTSTHQEVVDQWGLYDGFDLNLERALRSFKHGGRHMPKMEVIPPGLDFSRMNLKDVRDVPDGEDQMAPASPESPRRRANGEFHVVTSQLVVERDESPRIWREIARFLRNPHKPAVLAMSRPDAKKNIATLVRAFGEHPVLREVANLVLVMGNRENIESMAAGSQKVLDQVLRLIDAYDLYGSVAYPKRHASDDVTDIYRYAYRTNGVFVNIALQEPFGLTLIEAAAHGVPLVATTHGGPTDIIATLKSGYLVEPTDSAAVADHILRILGNQPLWQQLSHSGLSNIHQYSWESHCRRYLNTIETRKRLASVPLHKRTFTGSWDVPNLVDRMAAKAKEAGATWMGPFKANTRVPPLGADGMAASPSITFDDSFINLVNASASVGAGEEESASFTSILAVCVDGPVSAPTALDGLKMAIAYRKLARRKHRVAIVVLAMEDLDSIKAALSHRAISLAEINYVAANAGAELWAVKAEAAEPDEVAIESIDEYDEHIFHRWDATTVFRTLIRASQSSRGGTLLEPLVQDPGKQYPVHPFHIMACVSSKEASPQTLCGQVRRRLRQNGIRCQMTLVAGPEAPHTTYAGDLVSDSVALIHLTPLRASRSLALRWLALYLGISPSQCPVICAAARTPDGKAFASLSSDTPDILGGAQPTLILQAPPAAADDPGSVLVPTSVVEEWGTRLCCAADRRAAEEWMAGLKLT